MIVTIRIEVNEEDCKVIRKTEGRKGKATRKEIANKVHATWAELLHDLYDDAERNEK